MILENKTKQTQSLYLKDGSKVTARPFRTIELNDKDVESFDRAVWQVQKEEIKKTIKGNE